MPSQPQTPILKLSTFVPERPPIEVATEDGVKTIYLKLWGDFPISEQMALGDRWETVIEIERQAARSARGETEDDGSPVPPVSAEDDQRHQDLVDEIAGMVTTDSDVVALLNHEAKQAIVEAFFSMRLANSGRTQMLEWASEQARSTSNGSSRKSSTTGRSKTRRRG